MILEDFQGTTGGGQGKQKYPARKCRVCTIHKKWNALHLWVLWGTCTQQGMFIEPLHTRNTRIFGDDLFVSYPELN